MDAAAKAEHHQRYADMFGADLVEGGYDYRWHDMVAAQAMYRLHSEEAAANAAQPELEW